MRQIASSVGLWATRRPSVELALALMLVLAPHFAGAQGVPIVDGKAVILQGGQLTEEAALRAELEAQNLKRDQVSSLDDEQIAALEQTLAMLTGSSAFIGDLEGLGGGLAASEAYAIDDNNPYAGRLFGDARVTIEEMIIETAKRYGGHPALVRAGINPVEFRCWFQGLVKQESGFSIGARSPAAAFGLTQIIPGTAKYLGVYPEYYDDPRLQLDGGARYLLEQLSAFGSMPLALAAYNAGPGAVQKYGGIPPYKETQDYVVRITSNYNAYASKIEGVDTVGTLDPADMVIAESSNVADAGLHYGMASSEILADAMRRLKLIVEKIPNTATTKEALDLNSYARAEVVRIAGVVARLKAVRVKVEQARYALLLQAYAKDALFLKVKE
jgi:soluble lytic murein transglycosylase-like protein